MAFWRALLRETGLSRAAGTRPVDTTAPAPVDPRGEPVEEYVRVRVASPSGAASADAPAVPEASAAPTVPESGAGSVATADTAVSPLPRRPVAREGSAGRNGGSRAASLERTLQSLVERHGTEHPDTITARNNLATKYAQMGRRLAAVQQFELALTEAVSVHGDEHPRTEIIRENLAWALEDAGQPAEAAAQWEVLLREREEQFGPADEDTVEARSHLAACYRRDGRLDAAIAHYERAIEDVASTERREELRLGLSMALSQSGRCEASISQLRTVLMARRRRLGKGHLDTLGVHHRLGRAFTQAGRADEAVEVLRDAYRVAMNSSGDPEVRRLTLRLRRDLAGAYNAAGRPREANALL
ncbi:tetratricopeptide repeat protein [Nocardiopsis sp. EMB25]|uniref:tetratricopeptide repeat protein n=1 Tax=Nocardiopsis sp. EMB25 TaxID=2835867 RepID=UPI002283548B|nr:tetratricopeptide repeat protein [Nocardiopsis sp. EMB25]MCY9784458.1 tetratricopeptide repeat protein [Nocardiopsis sp. EMB25]